MKRYYAIIWIGILGLALACKNQKISDDMAADGTAVQDSIKPKPVNIGEALFQQLDTTAEYIPKSHLSEYLYAAEPMRKLYEENEWKAVWVNEEGALNKQGVALLEILKDTKIFGLENKYYHFAKIDSVAKLVTAGKQSPEVLGELELSLTNSLCLLALHLQEGIVDTSGLLKSDFSAIASQLDPWLKNAVSSKNLLRDLKSLEPKHMHYRALSKALVAYKEAKNVLPAGFSIRDHKKDSAGCAADVIQALRYQGYLKDSSFVDYEKYQSTLKAFQKKNGLVDDGVPGANTRMLLLTDNAERYRRAALNMDKWRRVAHNLPKEYIFVNIPGYEAYVVNSDTLVETHKVIVGKPANKTPEIISRINTVVINPDWTVPYSIIKKEMRGKSYSYLSKYKIYQNGQRVSPGNIHWGQNIRMVQPPGPNNSLGFIKFLFPNSHSVYLHDTPSRSLFNTSVRAYSHGCIRVQNPLYLGLYLLEREGRPMTMDSMQAVIKEGNTTNITLKNTMPVYILYFTAHASNDGVLELYPDIYKKEEKDISVLFYGHYKKPADYKKGKKAIPSMQVKPNVKEESEEDPEIIAGVLGRKLGLIYFYPQNRV